MTLDRSSILSVSMLLLLTLGMPRFSCCQDDTRRMRLVESHVPPGVNCANADIPPLQRMESRQYCFLAQDVDRMRSAFLGEQFAPDAVTCRRSSDNVRKAIVFWKSMEDWSKKLRATYPQGFVALDKQTDPYKISSTITELESRAKPEILRLEWLRQECEYISRRKPSLLRLGQNEILGGFSALASATDRNRNLLNQAFDGSGILGAAAIDVSAGSSVDDSSLVNPRARPIIGPRRSVSGRTFAYLTSGIALDVSENVNDAGKIKAVFDLAIRDLGGIPTGREVLAEVQRLRGRFAENIARSVVGDRIVIPQGDVLLSGIFENEQQMVDEEEADLPGRAEQRVRSDEFRKRYIASVARGEQLHVVVQVVPDDSLEKGYVTGRVHMDRQGKFVMPVLLQVKSFQDGNPRRAVALVAQHELKHIDDWELIGGLRESGVTWQIVEDRAYLKEFRAYMEMLPAMQNEPAGQFLKTERMAVKGVLDDPTAFRMRYLTNPLYIWNRTLADLDDPSTGMRGRLLHVYNEFQHAASEKRSVEPLIESLDPTRELWHAFQRANQRWMMTGAGDAERRIEKDGPREEFFSIAGNTVFVRQWLNQMRNLAQEVQSSPTNDRPRWYANLTRAERQFHEQLADFVKDYGSRDVDRPN